MPAKVTVLPLWAASKEPTGKGVVKVSTVSKASGIWSGLSPFKLGPVALYERKPYFTSTSYGPMVSLNVENAWQYSKVYPEHCEHKNGIVTKLKDKWWSWAMTGWGTIQAHRYPMGKGKKPLFSYWDGEFLDYVSARKTIYAPLYAEAVRKTMAWKELKKLYESKKELVLLDYDAYDHRALKYSLTDVLNDPKRKMGHAFVLAMMLTMDPSLDQIELRFDPMRLK